ncbi:hypothetical protein N431DRAFT_556400 [Stipitochalara longipes BDJ]|nr:hypothetical protein N431DRAFT_556400 [Stipitochalara longipes BDJ]
MGSSHLLTLCAALFLVSFGFESSQKILGGNWVHERLDGIERFSAAEDKQTVLDAFSSTHGMVFYKDYKSTPPSFSPKVQNINTLSNEILLDFDDIKTKEPLANITSYKNMTFASWKVVNVSLAVEKGLLDEEDRDKSLSAPNAILGSEEFSPGVATVPRIYVSPSSVSEECEEEMKGKWEEDFPHRFQPIYIRLKPVGEIEKEGLVIIAINAWMLDGRDVLDVYGAGIIWGGPGHVHSFRLGMAHWGKEGQGVNVLEIKCYDWKDGKKGGERKFLADDLVIKIL